MTNTLDTIWEVDDALWAIQLAGAVEMPSGPP